LKIAVLHFVHETVTFLSNETTLNDFIYEGSPAKGEALLSIDPKSYMGGFVKAAREHADVELVGIESPLEPKTGIGSGWITTEAFEHFLGRMVDELRSQGPFDGVYLALHGAMGVTGVPRPEAEIARRVREVVGKSAFIAATFDPHGNEDEAFLASADLAFTVKYYPHYDAYLQGTRAARNLIRCIRDDFTPTHASRKVPLISPTVVQWTGGAAWMSLINRALTWEAREPDVYVNVFFGFPWADVPDAGMFVQVTTNGNPALALEVVEDMSQAIWRQKDALLTSTKIVPVSDAVEEAASACQRGVFPIVIADHSDRSGSATWVLGQVIQQALADTVVATVTDASVLDTLQEKRLVSGDEVEIEVGGRVDPSAGRPLAVRGKLVTVPELQAKDAGQLPFATLSFGHNNLLVISRYLKQVIEPSELAQFGVDVNAFKVFTIKSRVHFRRGFDDSGFAKAIIITEPDEAFLGTTRLDGLEYINVDLSSFYPYRKDITL
jgi:microcystin degradation protein MlrC